MHKKEHEMSCKAMKKPKGMKKEEPKKKTAMIKREKK